MRGKSKRAGGLRIVGHLLVTSLASVRGSWRESASEANARSISVRGRLRVSTSFGDLR